MCNLAKRANKSELHIYGNVRCTVDPPESKKNPPVRKVCPTLNYDCSKHENGSALDLLRPRAIMGLGWPIPGVVEGDQGSVDEDSCVSIFGVAVRVAIRLRHVAKDSVQC
jgi:hypothetical protein